MQGKISRQVFDKIRQEDIKMRPSYYFQLVFVFWKLLAAVILVFASIILSLSFYRFSFLQDPFTLVYVLITILLVFLASRSYRRSKLCCRHEDLYLMGIMMFMVILAGMAVYSLDLSRPLHDRIEAKLEQRKTIIVP